MRRYFGDNASSPLKISPFVCLLTNQIGLLTRNCIHILISHDNPSVFCQISLLNSFICLWFKSHITSAYLDVEKLRIDHSLEIINFLTTIAGST